ncbi:TRPV3-like protein [Mya arenaria]|uniref:TRPV3-like protein n=1 Tax=Mya arenaria TaxID=6604 RepID=A0ABY7ESU5_MYAAR|nr:TRPV3-like protein [Mya arenaria]
MENKEGNRNVANKTRTLLIGRQEAEMEVLTDMIVSKTGNFDRALIYVLGHWKNESKILVMVNSLIHRGANTSAADESLKTPLHFAVEQGLKGSVTGKLLENDALPHSRDRDGRLALETALKNENDELAALLLAYMPNRFVRGLFLSDNNKPAEFSLHKLIRSEKLQRTVLSVLDCTIESQGSANSIKVYYGALEADEAGQPPDHPEFKYTDKSCLHVIAKQGNKVKHSLLHAFAVLHHVRSGDVSDGAGPKDLSWYPARDTSGLRGPVARHGRTHIAHGNQSVEKRSHVFYIHRHRLEYFHDVFNWFDFSASILLVVVVPLRFTDNIAQWHVLAIGYILWTLRIFKYAAVFRQSGAYALILSRILVYDFMQFILVFIVILLAFSVSFYLALRGDSGLNIHDETRCAINIKVYKRSLSCLQIYTSFITIVGTRTCTKIILSMILMLCFLFTCIVILLNILIAQVTDTYQKVQQDAQRGLEVNRAWIVSRVELNSCIFGHTHYKEFEEIKDLKSVLDKWESPPLNEMSKYVRDVWDSIDSHRLSLLTVQQRLARQENTLRDIQEQLSCLVEAVGQGGVRPRRSDTEYGPNTERPRFYRSDTEDGSNTVRPTRLGRES